MNVTAILASVNAFMAAMTPVISVLSVLAAIWVFASAARMLLSEDRGQVNLAGVGAKLFVGAALVQLGTSIRWTRDLLGGSGSGVRTAMAYVIPSSGSTIWSQVLSAGLKWLAVIGVIAVFRGFMQWNAAASGDRQDKDMFWAGLWHIVGGAICINIGS